MCATLRLGHLDRCSDTGLAVIELGGVGHVHDPDGRHDLLARRRAGVAAAVPALEHLQQRGRDVLAQPEAHREFAGEPAVAGAHRCRRLGPGHHELGKAPCALGRREPSADVAVITRRWFHGVRSIACIAARLAMSSPNRYACS